MLSKLPVNRRIWFLWDISLLLLTDICVSITHYRDYHRADVADFKSSFFFQIGGPRVSLINMAPHTPQKSGRVIVEPKSFADAVKMMLKHSLKMTSTQKLSMRNGCLVIDIELRVKRNFYTVQITHCGRWTDRGIDHLFDELCSMVKSGLLPNCDAVIAHIFARTAGEENETDYRIGGAPNFDRKKIVLSNGFVHFPSFKNYALIKLQYKLPSHHLLEFKEILIAEFGKLKKSHSNVKITFYMGKEVFYTNHVASDTDFQDCRSLSLPLTDVMRQTMNTEFRDRCLKTLRVNNIYDAQKVLQRVLFSMNHDNYMIP